VPNPPAAVEFGFAGDEKTGWTRVLRDRDVRFRVLRTLNELRDAEVLQSDAFQVSERDLLSNVTLLSVAETGGAVIAAYLAEEPARPVGVLIGWGGFRGRPRMVSDLLVVRPDVRNLGLGAELKRLQAAIALERGFEEISWTVDPLRAANARLNFAKLGAISRQYEIDRYGSDFAAGLYGGLPTDRLHLVWEIASPRIIARLRGEMSSEHGSNFASYRPYAPGIEDDVALVSIPEDIDALVISSASAALEWRLRVRSSLTQAFAEGFAITGFEPSARSGDPTYVLTRAIRPTR
jgi:predicted GNAT superfamily acetyltransferase